MGFSTGISGADLVYGQIQAMKFGTRFAMPRTVEALSDDDGTFCARLDDGDEVCAKPAVATGVQYRRPPSTGWKSSKVRACSMRPPTWKRCSAATPRRW